MKKFLALGCLLGCLFLRYSQASGFEPEPAQESPSVTTPRMVFVSARDVSSEAGYILLIKEHPLSDKKDQYRRPLCGLSYISILSPENKEAFAAKTGAVSDQKSAAIAIQHDDKTVDWRVVRRVFLYRAAWPCTEEAWWTYYRIQKSDFSNKNNLYLAFNDATQTGNFSAGYSMCLSPDFKMLDTGYKVEFTNKNYTACIFHEDTAIPDPPCCCCALWACSALSSCFCNCCWG